MGKSGLRKGLPTLDEAQIIALKILAFLAADDERLGGFLRMTGTSPEALRANAAQQEFLAGVLQYVLHNEALLVECAASCEIDPNLPRLALDALDPRDRESVRQRGFRE